MSNEVLSEAEIHARYAAKAEQYAKLLNIEANVMVHMARRQYLPAIMGFSDSVVQVVLNRKSAGIGAKTEEELACKLADGIASISELTSELEDKNARAASVEDLGERDEYYRDEVLPTMEALRASVDAMESICAKECWPVPSYNDMLFYV